MFISVYLFISTPPRCTRLDCARCGVRCQVYSNQVQ